MVGESGCTAGRKDALSFLETDGLPALSIPCRPRDMHGMRWRSRNWRDVGCPIHLGRVQATALAAPGLTGCLTLVQRMGLASWWHCGSASLF